MAVVYHEIYLPIDTESTFDYIVIKQGDAGTHRVRATLISNNRVYTIHTSGASYFMKFRKPDNNYCLVEATVSDNTISAEVTEEMLRVSGTGRGEFMIVSGSNELKTATFHVKIVKETYTSEDVQSHSDFAPFAALLQGAGAAASNANTAAAAANAAARLAEQKAQAIPDDYSELVAEVAGKADQSNTYTKDQVDGLIEDVTVETDTTLEVSGAPADAAETGRQLGLINESLSNVQADLGNLSNLETESKTDLVSAINEASKSGLSDDAKAALLACFDNVLWKDGTSPSSYNALENALYPNSYPKITASFNSGANTIYTDNTLSTLKQYLTVKYYESSESAGVTVSSENYALTGALVAGTSVVYVSYNNLVCSFTIYNVVDFYNTWKWETTQLGQITAYQGTADPNQADTTKYPSRVFYNANNAMRRTVGTSRGKRSYNVYNQTGVNPNVYPIPVPANATKYSIKVAPTSTPYYVFCHVCEYANGAYGDSITNYRTTWTRCSEESPVEKDITGHPANAFMIVNIKYDSAGTTNPPVPDNVTIEFSED